MYICASLNELNQCTEWVTLADAWGVPAGTGLQIGGMFFAIVAAAWGVQQIARLVLNRY